MYKKLKSLRHKFNSKLFLFSQYQCSHYHPYYELKLGVLWCKQNENYLFWHDLSFKDIPLTIPVRVILLKF